MPPPNVLHVSHTSHRGGAELALARLLAQEHEWRAGICAPPGGDAFDALPAHGVRVALDLPELPTGGTRSRSPALVARYLNGLRASARALRRGPLYREADVLHANTAAAGIICGLIGRRRAPLVVHVRDQVATESLGKFGLTAFTRLALGRADGVVANSRSTLESAEHWLAPDVPRTVIQSPIGVASRVTAARVRPEVATIGMVGRLQRWKGQHVFIEAFAREFRGTPVRAHLAGAPLFGESAYEEELRKLAARLGVAEQVRLLGHVDDIGGFLDSIDVLVHASTRPEPLGQTVIQGLAHGKPIVATEGGGPSEWIRTGFNGLLIPADQPEALGKAMREVADSAELRAKLASGAVHTDGIQTDRECMAAQAAFFTDVRQRSASERRHQ
ncbi:glycosyltransferase [Phytohabitans kaempferiae]|uniref:Glycosyltransferase n=1 Tax=Phytohabitans kaempferiae TaxID=1620943 RepID=A0ABV6MF66_9ACTN